MHCVRVTEKFLFALILKPQWTIYAALSIIIVIKFEPKFLFSLTYYFCNSSSGSNVKYRKRWLEFSLLFVKYGVCSSREDIKWYDNKVAGHKSVYFQFIASS